MEAVLGITRSLGGRRWVWRVAEDRLGLGIAQRMGVPEIVGRLLAARGVGIEGAGDFLDPTLRALLPDPSLLIDMDAAADRLAAAAARGETVGVFGDYDVDGACAAALMVTLLRDLGCTVHTHVPHRLNEGYGPNPTALRRLAELGATVIVCVDCGTAAGEALAAVHGAADVLVLDHHKAEGPPPAVFATVNPNRLDDTLGHGIAVCRGGGVPDRGGDAAGIAPARVLRPARGAGPAWPAGPGRFGDGLRHDAADGREQGAGVPRAEGDGAAGAARHRRAAGRGADARPASAFTCGFGLGPRINAAGRISDADLGLRLLLAQDATEATALATLLDDVNRQRQEVEATVLDAAFRIAEAQAAAGHAALLVCGEGWHPGVVGIVAGRIKERFNRPACVAGVADGVAKGSGRSVAGLDLGAAVIAARQAGILLTGGGHSMAAGFSLEGGRIDAFHASSNERSAAAGYCSSQFHLGLGGLWTRRLSDLALFRLSR